MPPFLVGTTTHKAPRRIPDTRINPDGVLLRRFERQGTEKLTSALSKLRRGLFAGLNADSIGQVVTRLNDPKIMQPFKDTVDSLLQEWALAGADFGREQVERTIFGTKQVVSGIAVDWTLANEAAGAWAQGYSFELVNGIKSTTRTTLQREIAGFTDSGETFQQFSRRLEASELFSKGRAELIATTEVTRAYAQGNKAAWKESGVVEGQEWNTANDELVCPICGPLDGEQTGLDDDFENGVNFPAHPRCRCWPTPVTVGDLETGQEIFDRLGLERGEFPGFGGTTNGRRPGYSTELENAHHIFELDPPEGYTVGGPGNFSTVSGDDVLLDFDRAGGIARPENATEFYDEWHDKLSQDHKKALQGYSGGDYQPINNLLRTGTSPTEGRNPILDANYKLQVEDVKNAIDAAPPLPANLKVYRKFGRLDLDQFVPGDIIVDDGFMSTTLSKSATDLNFSGDIAEIVIPKGTKSARLGWTDLADHPEELEMLFSPGSKMRIIDKITLDNGEQRVIMEMFGG